MVFDKHLRRNQKEQTKLPIRVNLAFQCDIQIDSVNFFFNHLEYTAQFQLAT